MSINESIYGAKSDWVSFGGVTSDDENNKFKLANFGNNLSKLSDGVTANKLAYNTPIDKSLSWCGLGSNSTFSNVEYYRRLYNSYSSGGETYEFGLYRKEQRTVTNFLWAYSSNISPSLGVTWSSSTSNSDYGGYMRWSPSAAFNIAGDVTANSNSSIQPIVQIPVKNCVFVPKLAVRKNITDITTANETTVLIWDYLDLNNSVNYTTHPYITHIGIVPYGKSDNDNERTQKAGSSTNVCAISVIDTCNFQKDNPKYLDNYTERMDLIYSYAGNYFGAQNLNYIIFGAQMVGFSNSNLYHTGMSNAATTGTQGINNRLQLVPVLPHPQGVWSDPINTSYRTYYVEYYDGLREWIRRQIACFGLFFTDDETAAKTGTLTDENMFLGILENGVGNGDYAHGILNALQPQFNWDTTNDSNYDGNNPPDIDTNSYNGVMDTAGAPVALATATERYVIADTNINKLLTKLWDVMALADPTTMTKSDYALDMFLTNNPIDAIVSLQYVPVKDMGIGSTTVALGKYDTRISAAHAETSVVKDCGTIKIFPRCGDNWIDREMKLTLYLPFCGVVDLDPETYINRNCNVEYLIDLTTGTCSAVVSFISDNGNRVITDIANGVCAIDLPVTGLQQQTLNSELFNASESTKQLKVNNAFKGFKSLMGAVNSLQGNPTGAIDSILGGAADFYNIFQSEKIADYNLQHTIIPTKMIGTSGGLTGVMATIKPTIIYSIPVNDVNYSTYGHSIGFACCESGVLSGYSGYTECTNVDLSGFSATTTEKNMIQSALAGGVYL